MLNFQPDGGDLHGHRLLIRCGRGHVDRTVSEREVGDVGDRADGFIGPYRVHAGTGLDTGGARIPCVDSVQQRGVGTV